MALIINLMYGKLTERLIKISIINSFTLSVGVLLNIIITRNLVKKIRGGLIYLIAFFLIIGINLSGFFYILVTEPFFFLYGSRLIYSYFLINLLFVLTLTFLTTGFLTYQQKIQEQEGIIHKERGLRREIEEQLYKSKINPHFLFNSLNLMVSLLKDPIKAEEAIISLSQLLRYNLDASKQEWIDLKDEMESVERYLSIQKMRFGERLEYHLNFQHEGKVPPLIIQPLVENSIKHNINNVDKLTLEVDIRKQDHQLIVEVKDSCQKVDPAMMNKGTGLTVTKKRVELAGGHFNIRGGNIIMEFNK